MKGDTPDLNGGFSKWEWNELRIQTDNGESCASFEISHDGYNQVNASVSIDHDNLFPLHSTTYQMVSKDVGSVVDRLVRKHDLLLGLLKAFSGNALDDTWLVGVSACVPREDVRDGTLPSAPVEVCCGIWKVRTLGCSKQWDRADG